MTDVFISYKKEDADRVAPIARALAQAGYEVWWDHRIPAGRTYREVIGAAVESARCVIVVWSKLSADSQWVLDEADAGKQRNVLLPVMLDEVPIPMGFRQIESARLIGWRGNADAPEWRNVLESVAHFVGRAPGGPAKPFTTPSAAPSRREAPARSGGGGGGMIIALVALLAAGGGAFGAWQMGVFGPKATQVAETADPGAPVETSAPAGDAPAATAPTGSAPPPQTTAPQTTAPQTTAPQTTAPQTPAPESPAAETPSPASPPPQDPATPGVRPGVRLDPALKAGTIAIRPEVLSPAIRDLAVAGLGTTEGVVRVAFNNGGGLVKQGDVWVELGENGSPNGFRWTESTRSDVAIVFEDPSRGARIRINLAERAGYLYFPDWGKFQKQWEITSVRRARP